MVKGDDISINKVGSDILGSTNDKPVSHVHAYRDAIANLEKNFALHPRITHR